MSMIDVIRVRTGENASMAKEGPVRYTHAMLHRAFTGEPSDYAYSEAAKRNMDISDFMTKYEGKARTKEPKAKKAKANGYAPGKRRKPHEERDV